MYIIKRKEEFKEKINEEFVIVDFYADWCGPCQALGTVLEELDNEYNLNIVKINTDTFMSIARDYHIITIPNIKIFRKGKILREKTGIMTKSELMDFIGEENLQRK